MAIPGAATIGVEKQRREQQILDLGRLADRHNSTVRMISSFCEAGYARYD